MKTVTDRKYKTLSEPDTVTNDGDISGVTERELLAGLILEGKYEIIEHLDSGGMADVYLARQIRLNRVVAIKVLNQKFAHTPWYIERFQHEADTLAKISHPNITSVLDRGKEYGIHYLVMEFVDGGTLDDYIFFSSEISIDFWIKVICSCAEALTYIHDLGFIHLDVKPSNIIIDQKGIVKLADFGIARLQNAHTIIDKGSAPGTFKYMSPEQKENNPDLDHRSDLYSLAITFYRMFTGHFPGEEYISVCFYTDELKPGLDIILYRALDQNPNKRFNSVSEFCDRLLQYFTKEHGVSLSIKELRNSTVIPQINTEQLRKIKKNKNSSASESRKNHLATVPTLFITTTIIAVVVIVLNFRNPSEVQNKLESNNQTSAQVNNDQSLDLQSFAEVVEVAGARIKIQEEEIQKSLNDLSNLFKQLERPKNWTYLTLTLPEGEYEYAYFVEPQKWIVDFYNPPSNSSDENQSSTFEIPGGATDQFGNRLEWPRVNDTTGEVRFRFENAHQDPVYVLGTFNNWEVSEGYVLK